VGVSAIPDKVEFRDEVRIVKEWKLWEISSLTKWPANDLAGTHEIKTIEDIKNIQEYYDWMSEKGLHTDEFILQIENLLKKLKQEPPVKALKKEEEPEVSTLNYNYLIQNL
jgi:hypothetical protein